MDLVSIFPTESTYINSQYPCVNYINSKKLRIDNFQCEYSNVLISFPLKIYNRNSKLNYYLYIPLKNIEYCKEENMVDINIVYDCIDYDNVNYNCTNNMDIYRYSCIYINEIDINKRYVLVDISSLINRYIEKEMLVLNIMLSSPSKNFSIIFNKDYFNCMPKLMVDTEFCDFDNRCNTKCRKTIAMQLVLSDLYEKNIVYNNDNIRFDNIVEQSPKGIYYEFENGLIGICEKGYYLFQWNVNIEGSNQIDTLSIDLKNNMKNTIIPSPVPMSIQGQISGTALVCVNSNHETFSLVNTSGGDLLLSNLCPCASITIVKI